MNRPLSFAGCPSSIWLTAFVAAVVAATWLVACTANTVINADLGGRGSVPANAAEVKACQDGCAARASCAAVTSTNCSQKCEQTTSDNAVGFRNCVATAKCNPQCDQQLGGSAPAEDAAVPDASPPVPDAAEAVDAGPDSSNEDGLSECLGACNTSTEVLECLSGGKSQCMSQCTSAKPAQRVAFVTCESSTACSAWLSTCYSRLVSTSPSP